MKTPLEHLESLRRRHSSRSTALVKAMGEDEMLRLAALDRYEAIGAPSDPLIEEITSLAAELCNTPSAGIALIAAEVIHFYSCVGGGPMQVARGQTPWEMCLRGEIVYEVPDARYHRDFRPDGMMAGGRAICFYAGAPLVTPSDLTIGCVFVQDSVPHTLADTQRRALATLSRQVITHFELNVRVRTMDRDLRVRQRVEAALSVERNFVAAVLDTVGALVAVFDTAGRIVRVNRECEEVSGYGSNKLVGGFVWDRLIPEGEIPGAIATFEHLRDGSLPTSFENCWQSQDGSLHRIAWSATALVDEQGDTTFIIATGIEVTKQRAAEATLQQSEARYRMLVEGSLGMVCTHDLRGLLLSVNVHGAESLGWSVEELLGRSVVTLLPDKSGAAFTRYLKTVADRGESKGRVKLRHRNGDIRVIAFHNKLIVPPTGAPSRREMYVLGFGVDISEQVRAEESLRALAHQSESILESVGDGIFGIDLEGRVTMINPAAAAMLAYEPEELLGREMHGLIHHTRLDGTAYPADACPIMQTIQKLNTVRILDEVFWRKDGTSFPAEYVARPQISPGGGEERQLAVGVVVAFTDTTERRALDQMKDDFISTVSHELRTPLTSLRAALGLVSGGALATRPEKMQQMLEIAIGSTDRLIHLVNDILDIERMSSGNAELHLVKFSTQAVMERAVSLQQATALKMNLSFRMELTDIEVFADPDRILQALLNLIKNATKFSPRGGLITLIVRKLDEHQAQFEVTDQGRGIPADKLESIFERFQHADASDARSMGGAGLGLAISRSIIAQHGGRIWATSPHGEGASFHFTLPTHARSDLR